MGNYLEEGRPKEDRLRGEEAEEMFMELLRKKGRTPTQTQNYFPDYDIEDEKYKYEVKLDRKFQDTGNVYVERKSLFKSWADYYIYFVSSVHYPFYFIYCTPTAKLRNFYRSKAEISGGDFKEPGILLNTEEFESVFKVIGYANSKTKQKAT